MSSYKQVETDKINLENKKEISSEDVKVIVDDDPEFNVFIDEFRKSISNFSTFYGEEKYDEALESIGTASQQMQSAQILIFERKISEKIFVEILDEESFIETMTSVLENGMSPICLTMLTLIQVITGTFKKTKEFFSKVDLFGALCSCITGLDEDSETTGVDFRPVFECMNLYVKICARKHDNELSCFFDDVNDIVCWLTQEIKVEDVLEFLIKVCRIKTINKSQLSAIPTALIDTFDDEIADVDDVSEMNLNIYTAMADLFAEILLNDPESVVIFQNEETKFFSTIAYRIIAFPFNEDNEDVNLSVISFISNYNRAIALHDENCSSANFPKDFLASYIHPIIVSFLSHDDEVFNIHAVAYLRSLAMINPELMYYGITPKTIYDFSKTMMKRNSMQLKLATFEMITTIVGQNDHVYVSTILGDKEFFEICNDAAGSHDANIVHCYMDFLNGMINVVTHSNEMQRDQFSQYVTEIGIIDDVEEISQETEGHLHDVTTEVLYKLNSF